MRVGIIGYGDSGHSFAAAAYVTEGVELVFVGGRNPEKAKALADQWHVASGPVEELVQRDDVDCIAISTPPGRRLDDVLPCLEHGKHVMIEKPMGLTVATCRTMIDAAAKHGVRIMVTQTQRYTRCARAAKKLIASGNFGRVIHVSVFDTHNYFTGKRSGWQLDWAMSGGGVTMNPFIHFIDLARWFAGGEVTEIRGIVGFHKEGFDIEGNIEAFARFDHGATAYVEVDGYGQQRSTHENSVSLERARIIPDQNDACLKIFQGGSMREVVGFGPRYVKRGDVTSHDGYAEHMVEMRDALEHGGPITSDGYNGMKNVELATTILAQNGIEPGVGRV